MTLRKMYDSIWKKITLKYTVHKNVETHINLTLNSIDNYTEIYDSI